MAFHTVNCCETVRKLAWALSVLSSDDVWLFGRLGDKLAERQEAKGDLDLDRPVPISQKSTNKNINLQCLFDWNWICLYSLHISM